MPGLYYETEVLPFSSSSSTGCIAWTTDAETPLGATSSSLDLSTCSSLGYEEDTCLFHTNIEKQRASALFASQCLPQSLSFLVSAVKAYIQAGPAIARGGVMAKGLHPPQGPALPLPPPQQQQHPPPPPPLVPPHTGGGGGAASITGTSPAGNEQSPFLLLYRGGASPHFRCLPRLCYSFVLTNKSTPHPLHACLKETYELFALVPARGGCGRRRRVSLWFLLQEQSGEGGQEAGAREFVGSFFLCFALVKGKPLEVGQAFRGVFFRQQSHSPHKMPVP